MTLFSKPPPDPTRQKSLCLFLWASKLYLTSCSIALISRKNWICFWTLKSQWLNLAKCVFSTLLQKTKHIQLFNVMRFWLLAYNETEATAPTTVCFPWSAICESYRAKKALLILKYYLQFLLYWINTNTCGDFYQTSMTSNLPQFIMKDCVWYMICN